MSAHDRSTIKNIVIFFLSSAVIYLCTIVYGDKVQVVKTAADVNKVSHSELVTANLVKRNAKTQDTIKKLLLTKVSHDSIAIISDTAPVRLISQLEQKANENATLKDSLVSTVKKTEVIKKLVYYYQNKYLQFRYPVSNDADTIFKNSTLLSLQRRDHSATIFKAKMVIGTQVSYIDLSTSDTNTTINGNAHYEFIQKQPLFGLRIQAVSTYGFFSKTVGLGLGAAFNFNRFTFLNSYLYDLRFPFDGKQPRRFNVIFSGKYDLVRF